MRFEELERAGAFRVLAQLFPDEVTSRQLLLGAGIRPGQIRPFGQLPQELYWREIIRTVDDGLLPDLDVGGFLALAHDSWPGNAQLKSLLGTGRSPRPGPDELRVLCLSAAPSDQNRLRLEAEHREIVMATRRTPRPIVAVLHPATQADDIAARLIDARPDIVHFGGHGTPSGELILEDAGGHSQLVDLAALGRLFAALKPLRAIVFSSCYSAGYAHSLAGVAKVVIGSPRPLDDRCALLFARYFYGLLAEALDLDRAFDATLAQMAVAGCAPHDIRLGRPGDD